MDARLTFDAIPSSPAIDSAISHGAIPALPIDANTPWPELPYGEAFTTIAIEPLSNHLTMVALRRAVHRAAALLPVGGRLVIDLRDPDLRASEPEPPWPGAPVDGPAGPEFHRPLRHYVELLRLFPFDIPVPRAVEGHADVLRITATRRAEPTAGALSTGALSVTERYDPDTEYRRFDRLEEPEIVDDLLYAWSRLASLRPERVLALGVNDGRELDLMDEVFPAEAFPAEAFPDGAVPERWGIDHSERAIAAARVRFPADAARFRVADLADLTTLGLPTFPVVIALGVLQCTSVDRDRLLADLKGVLAPRAGVLFSIPDCHRGARDILRRPYRRDDPRADRALVAKDVRYLVRWCHRVGFERVETFGSYDAFVLGMRSGRGR